MSGPQLVQPVVAEYLPDVDADEVIAFITRNVTGDALAAQEQVADHATGQGTSLIARSNGSVVGIVTLRWISNNPSFAEHDTPLVHQIAVDPSRRRQGVATALMDAAEELAAARDHHALGITVGLFDAYGPAQRLYARRGYLPDGRGVCRHHTPLQLGDRVTIDHDLMLWLTKELKDP